MVKRVLRASWRDLACVGLLFLSPLLLFWSVSVGGKTLLPADALYLFEPYRAAAASLGVQEVHNPLLADLILENYPWKQFLLDALRSRTLPLWDPYLFAGHPFLANGQHSALYPLTWLFFLIPIPRAFGVFTVLQLGFAGLWMFVLSRVLRSGRVGALVAGLVFQLSGFMVVSVVHPMIIAGASWLPLLLALVECLVSRRRFWRQERAMLPWALLGALALGLQVLAGHAEITYFSLLVMGGFALWRLAHRLWRAPRSEWRAEVVRPAAGLVLMVALGLALGAVQLLPFYEVVQDSFRQGAVTLQDVLGWAYPKRRVLTFLVPNFFGNPTHHAFVDLFSGRRIEAHQNAYGQPISSFDWGIKNYVEGGAYLGILPLLLALIGVAYPPLGQAFPESGASGWGKRAAAHLRRWWRDPFIPFFALLSLFSLGCVFGTPLYALVYALPFLNQSHSPFRWVFPLTVAVAALAGQGVTALSRLARLEDGSQEGRPMRWGISVGDVADGLGVLAVGAGLLTALGVGLSRLFYPQVSPVVELLFWRLAGAAYAFPDAHTFYLYLVPQVLLCALFLVLAGISVRLARRPLRLPGRLGRLPLWSWLLPLVVWADLFAFGRGFNPAVDPALLAYRPPVVDFLAQDHTLWRFSTFDPEGRNTFSANTGMYYRWQDVRGYDSLFSQQYARYMGWIEPQDQLLYNRIAPFRSFNSLDSPLTDLLNVKYIVTEFEIPLPKYRLVYQDDAVRVYENLGVAPRAFTLPLGATVVVSDVQAVHGALLTYDPRYFVIVERAPEGWLKGVPESLAYTPDPQPGQVQAQPISAYGLNEVQVDVTVDQPSWLILTDAFAPGWKAFVRPRGASQDAEREVSIGRVAGNFRGVLLEAGSTTVRFKYSPNSVKVGAFVSFLAGMAMIFLAVVWLWRLLYFERSNQGTVQRLAKNSIVPILLTVFNRTIEFAFAALMLRILGPANAGDYYYAINIFLWFDILTNFGLNTYVTREIARNREQAARYLVTSTWLRMTLSVLAVPILLSVIGLRQTLIAQMTSPASRQAIMALLLLYLGSLPYSLATGMTALYYAFEQAEYPAAVTSVTTILKVTVQTLALMSGLGIVGLAATSILINTVTLVILAVTAWRLFPELRRAGAHGWRTLKGLLDRGLRMEMVRSSWPLMVNHLLATLFYKIDVFLMEPILGSTALGLYSIGYKFLDTLMVIPSMFTLALFPVISRQARGDLGALRRFYTLGTKILITLALPMALLATLAAPEMVMVLGGSAYLPGAAVALRLMAWSMPIGWINSITQYALIALDRQRYLTRAYVLGFAFSVLSNLWLMPRLGAAGSAALHICAEAVLLVPFALGVRRYMGGIEWWEMLGKPLLAALLVGSGAVALLPVGRGVAVLTVVFLYPLAVWMLGVLSPEERALLAPLVRRGATPTVEGT